MKPGMMTSSVNAKSMRLTSSKNSRAVNEPWKDAEVEEGSREAVGVPSMNDDMSVPRVGARSRENPRMSRYGCGKSRMPQETFVQTM